MNKPNTTQHIICFALPAWHADYLRSTVELMKCAANDNLVIYVDYAYTFGDCLKAVLGKKKIDWKRILGFKNRLQKISGNTNQGLYVLSLPPIFPSFALNNYKLFKLANKFNAFLTGYYINQAAKKLKMKQIISFNAFQPFLGLYWKIHNVTFKIYYCYDDFTNVPYFKDFAAIDEKAYIAKVDLLIVTSTELQKTKTQANIPTEIVHNGVHFNAFNKYFATKQNPINTPITIGYTGSIDNRIDINLLETVVKDMPHLNFLFIGKVFDPQVFSRLSQYKNVTFLPPVAPECIPQLQSKINVGIIPYVLNSLTKAIYPLKANEYLAMGLPVVITPFASLGLADEVVYTAANSADFKSCLTLAIQPQSEEITNKRLEIAKNADWQQRTNQLMAFILKHKPTNAQ